MTVLVDVFNFSTGYSFFDNFNFLKIFSSPLKILKKLKRLKKGEKIC